ncbi:ABC transporter ATP-binding protein [Desulfoferrobacter suflitae]|uniref:ABC transporter ATP-binding protein n=1 Tax=Desulfoferrobacter suflitae TaxID=2865782 RepID=UPI0021642CF5|nr:ATP-binding cassette domain-containing protein [Desulfoferrobacter suflitae]MCK8603160.1 ATP-binding cassette domain-containing protein [Desulfoferrobacter suflitae]
MIRITQLHKTFNPGTVNEVHALRGVSLQMRAGEFVSLIGTNGSGKSTLLNGVAGTFLPDSGTVEIAGEDVSCRMDYQRARHVSRVFQNPFMGTAADMSVVENLHMAYLRGKRSYPKVGLTRERREVYREQVKLLEMQLEDRLDDVIGTLSGGQRQALTLLMAIISKPKVLLLDEHTAALDPKSAAQVIHLTRRFIAAQQLTTLVVTHSMQQALELGDRTVMMNKGEIIDDISREEKQHLTVNDLLDKFAELRKAERLTEDMLEALRREYL